MENVLSHAEAVLRQHPAPAMELDELHGRTRERLPVGMPSLGDFRQLMETQPRRFRVLDPLDGLATLASSGTNTPGGRGVLVISLQPHTEACGRAPGRRLRESVRWVAGVGDARALRRSARVYALLREGTSAHARLLRKAA